MTCPAQKVAIRSRHRRNAQRNHYKYKYSPAAARSRFKIPQAEKNKYIPHSCPWYSLIYCTGAPVDSSTSNSWLLVTFSLVDWLIDHQTYKSPALNGCGSGPLVVRLDIHTYRNRIKLLYGVLYLIRICCLYTL